MVHAHYCALYPKRPYVVHEVNMWCTCCLMSFVLDPSTLLSLTLTLCSKNKKIKQKEKEKEIEKTKSTVCELDTPTI